MAARPQPEVLAVPVTATYDLRRSVLRTGTATTEVELDGDDDASTVHLAVIEQPEGEPVAVSTWLERPWPLDPDVPAVQLRGMATAPDRRGVGLGSRLLAEGVRRARERGARYVWANARDTALGFYLAHGFEVVGDGHLDAATGLAHHLVVRRLP